MNSRKKEMYNSRHETKAETGQTLVLIALLLVGLLAFAGLATDAGMVFARSSQFSAAIDAATLAGVVDLSNGLPPATQRANEFLDANGWPVVQAIYTDTSQTTTALGYPQLNYTVTYPVETYFLGLVGFDEVPVTHSASAAIYSWADMPTATQAETGILRTAGLHVYGPDSCTAQGDPISAKWRESSVPNPLYTETGGKYTYRIRIPDDYGDDLAVQLFDPDSLNLRSGNGDLIEHTDGSTSSDLSCSSSGNGDSCFISTGEDLTANPVWLRRLDETWIDSGAGCPIRDQNNPTGNTVTRYELFHLDGDGDRVDLVAFESGGSIDQHTDMRWVTPDAANANVPAIPGSISKFVVDQGTISSIPTDENGNYNIYLDVTAIAGTSKNGWDVWAGPPGTYSEADGNRRNLEILSDLPNFSTGGVEIFAQGYLPTNAYHFPLRELPIATVEQSLGGSALSVSVFDFEADGPLTFFFSSVTRNDWEHPDGGGLFPTCNGSPDCNNKWIEPPIGFSVPSSDDPVNPAPFYGGYLIAEYPMLQDEHVWSVTLPLGRAFLTR